MTDRCRRCQHEGRDHPADLTAYWGHPLCSPCAIKTAADLDAKGKWPPVRWTTEDEQVLQ